MTATVSLTPAQAAEVADKLTQARKARELWEGEEKALSAILLKAHAAGIIPSKVENADATITVSTRRVWTYSNQTKKQIKAIQEIAQQDGSATQSESDPFLTVRLK